MSKLRLRSGQRAHNAVGSSSDVADANGSGLFSYIIYYTYSQLNNSHFNSSYYLCCTCIRYKLIGKKHIIDLIIFASETKKYAGQIRNEYIQYKWNTIFYAQFLVCILIQFNFYIFHWNYYSFIVVDSICRAQLLRNPLLDGRFTAITYCPHTWLSSKYIHYD